LHYGDLTQSEEPTAPALKAQYESLLTPLHLNSALACLRLGTPSWTRLAVESADRALALPGLSDGDRAKALYRRALATKDDEQKERNLAEAAKLVPEDQAVANELTKVRAAVKTKREAEKKKFKKMFA
jgi:peptidyl-prolyl isomerase D